MDHCCSERSNGTAARHSRSGSRPHAVNYNIAQAAAGAEAPNFASVEHSLRAGRPNPYLRRSAPSARTTSPLPRKCCCTEGAMRGECTVAGSGLGRQR